MPYSRSRTHGKNRARRARRFRFLLTLNVVLLLLVAVVLVWLFSENNRDGYAAKPPSSPADSASSSPVQATAPASPAGEEPPASQPSESATPEEGAATGEPGEAGDPGDPGDRGNITLAFVGDVLPASGVARLMEKNGYDYPFRESIGLLQAADITAGNLESAITDRGTQMQNKEYTYRGPKDALPAIRDAGFDVLSLANNHTLDYGWVGLQDTMDALDDYKLRHMGAGNDDKEAFAPAYIETKGMTVAFIGLSNVVPVVEWKADRNRPGLAETYNPTRAVAAIQEAKKNADLVVVLVHWGQEYKDRPIPDQTNKAHQFIDAGADLVIGSHPHVLQGFESYNGKWIAYSLGNFVFTATKSPLSAETGVLTAACGKDGNCSLQFHPMLAKNAQPAPMEEKAGQALLAKLETVSTAVTIKENGALVANR